MYLVWVFAAFKEISNFTSYYRIFRIYQKVEMRNYQKDEKKEFLANWEVDQMNHVNSTQAKQWLTFGNYMYNI